MVFKRRTQDSLRLRKEHEGQVLEMVMFEVIKWVCADFLISHNTSLHIYDVHTFLSAIILKRQKIKQTTNCNQFTLPKNVCFISFLK